MFSVGTCARQRKRFGHKLNISLDQSNISFVEDLNSKVDGIYAFVIKALDRNAILENAKLKGFLVNNEISIGGVKIILE